MTTSYKQSKDLRGSFHLFDNTLKHMLYSSQNLHRAYTDQGTDSRLRNTKHVKAKELITLPNFQDRTQDFQDYSKTDPSYLSKVSKLLL